MIKINLLGDSTTVDHSGKLQVFGFAASLGLCLIVFAAIQSWVVSQVSDSTQQVADLEVRLAKLKVITQEVRDLEAHKSELGLITATLAKLKLSQEGPVRVMDDLNLAVPGKVWLRGAEEKGGVMRIYGFALNDNEIVNLMKGLEVSNFFETVDLVESTTVALLKITTLNHFTAKYTRYTVRAEEKMLQLRNIQEEAKLLGLKYEFLDGPPSPTYGISGTVKVMGTDDPNKSRTVQAGVFKRGSGRMEKVSAWTSVEPASAKAFVILAKVAYSGRLRKLLADAGAQNDTAAPEKPDTQARRLNENGLIG